MNHYRKIKLITVFLISFSFTGCGINHNTKKQKGIVTKPKQEKIPHINGSFYIGGFIGNSYFIKIKNKKLSYAMTNNITHDKNWVHLKLSDKDIYNFEKKLSLLNVPNWKNNYSNLGARDGTQWLFHYKSSKIYIQSKGSNSYPSNFKELTQYISKVLLKGRSFE